MTTSLTVLLVSVLITRHLCTGNFVKCDVGRSDFDQCVSQAIQNVVTQFDKPVTKYGPKPFMVEFGDEDLRRRRRSLGPPSSGKIPITSARVNLERKILELNLTLCDRLEEDGKYTQGKFILYPNNAQTSTMRGLDYPAVSMVFNLDAPGKYRRSRKKSCKKSRGRKKKKCSSGGTAGGASEGEGMMEKVTFNFTSILTQKILNEELVVGISKKWDQISSFIAEFFSNLDVVFAGFFEGLETSYFLG